MATSDDKIQDPVVRALAEYIKTPQFQRPFEQFFLDNALAFTDETEHQLAYMTIYIEFQDMFNQHMKSRECCHENAFTALSLLSVSEEEFAAHCQKAMKVDPKAEQYLEIVIASMDYDAFYSLMKVMRVRASVETRRAEAKDGEPTPRSTGKRKTPEDKLNKDAGEEDEDGQDVKEEKAMEREEKEREERDSK
ncbi:hypothetical protein BBJ28_00018672 [Nothophytophthora sp. Chile5]|nr:hypothetical protein BBJ28_00018672 [Nothophytophthora sp. Chile5]